MEFTCMYCGEIVNSIKEGENYFQCPYCDNVNETK